MSRDLTPAEAVKIDRFFAEQHGMSLHLQEITYRDEEGEEVVFPSPDERVVLERYPTLAAAMNGSLLSFVPKKPPEFMDELESIVKALADEDEDVQASEEIVKWFDGKLDPGFYYNETNEALFLSYLEGLESPEELRGAVEEKERE